MNEIKATLCTLRNNEELTLSTFTANNTHLEMMSLQLPTTLHEGAELTLTCKATHIALAKPQNIQNCALSFNNQLPVKVQHIEHGELLCAVKLTFGPQILQSIITENAAKEMSLREGDALLALIHPSDLSIMKVSS